MGTATAPTTTGSEYLYVEPRKRSDDPFYVRVLGPDEHHPRIDGKRAAFMACNSRGEDLGEWMSESQLRKEGKKFSRAVLHAKRVLVPV